MLSSQQLVNDGMALMTAKVYIMEISSALGNTLFRRSARTLSTVCTAWEVTLKLSGKSLVAPSRCAHALFISGSHHTKSTYERKYFVFRECRENVRMYMVARWPWVTTLTRNIRQARSFVFPASSFSYSPLCKLVEHLQEIFARLR